MNKHVNKWQDTDVEEHWNSIATIYVEENNKVKKAHDQRFIETIKNLIVNAWASDVRVKKSDLYLELPVTYSTLALGGKVEVPTLDGKALLKVPAGTQAQELFRLRGKGLPVLNSGRRGNLIVRLIGWTPSKISREEEKLLQRLAELQEGHVPQPGEKH